MRSKIFASGLLLAGAVLFTAVDTVYAGVGANSGVGRGGSGVGRGGTGVGSGGTGVGSGGTGVGRGGTGVGRGGIGVGRNGVGLGRLGGGFGGEITGVGQGPHGIGVYGTGLARDRTPGFGSRESTSFASDGANGGSGIEFPHLGGYSFGGNSGISRTYFGKE